MISRRIILTGLALAALGGCGRKGPLEPPPVVAVPKATGEAVPAATPVKSKGKKKRVPINVPKDAFILDPIL